MTSAPAPAGNARELLPSALKVALWRGVERRLRRGEVLITSEQFVKAMVKEFRRQVRIDPTREVKRELLKMVLTVNETRPETYLSFGIRNAVTQFIHGAQERAPGEGAEQITEMIRRLINEGRTSFFLESIGVTVDGRTITSKVEQSILRIVEGKALKAAPRRQTHKRQRRASSARVAVHTTSAEESAEDVAAEIQALPDEQEQQQRLAEEQERAEALAQEELRKAPRNLKAYMEQKLLSEQEVADLRKLDGIDQRLADGEIDVAEANRLREEIEEGVRAKLRERLRAAVDHTVHYLSAWEALRRLPAGRDPALEMLIRHKNQVSADPELEIDLSVVTSALRQDDELLENLASLLERKDHEMRMMAAGMPPYRHIFTYGEKIGSFTIREDFVDDLRSLERDAVSERLNSEDNAVRIKTAADIKCMVALLAMLMAPSAFHNEVVRLRVLLRIKHTFEGAVSEREGRQRVLQFLRRRLPTLYPNLAPEVRASIDAESRQIIGLKEGVEVEEEKEDNIKRVYRA